ncbi:MAG: flavodoxin [Eubacteriales bacterium]|nr:flavodoxin [Eubacteriales bacterium]
MKVKKRIGSILLVLFLVVSILGNVKVPVSAAGTSKLNKTAITLQVGGKYRLSVRNIPKNGKVTWTSDSKSKATVSSKGVVTAKKQGKTNIKAKLTYTSGGKKRTRNFSCRVTITKKQKTSGKNLVVYFSAPVQERSGQVDGISSASRTTRSKTYKGNTEYIAELISKETKADLFEIVPQKAYADTYELMVQQAQEEQEKDARPGIKNKIKNISQYDTIYVGYPIWWSDMPQIMYTFFDAYNLQGKNIIPFCTHGGSGLSGTVERIKKLEPQATVYKGLEIYRTDVTNSDSRVKSWIQKKAK